MILFVRLIMWSFDKIKKTVMGTWMVEYKIYFKFENTNRTDHITILFNFGTAENHITRRISTFINRYLDEHNN